MTQLTANGRTYSDDGSAPLDMGNGGHRQNLLPMLGDVMHDTSTQSSAATATAAAAAGSASAAAGSAAAAQNYAAALTSTSATSLAIETGSKTFATQAGKQFAVGQWITATSAADSGKWMYGQVTSYTAASLVINVTAVGGSGTASDWAISISGIQPPAAVGAVPLNRSARTSNTQLSAADQGTLIDITSGTFTQTFAAAATLGNGWWCYLRNSGAGDITLDPNASELIDGLTSFVMYPGAVRLIQCDGLALRSIPIVGGTRLFTSSANYTWAPGIQSWAFDAIAAGSGGGGGARSTARYNGGGGGAGERYKGTIALSEISPGTSTLVTVGAAGTGGAAAAEDGSNAVSGLAGGNSSIASLRVATRGGKTGANNGTVALHGLGHQGGGAVIVSGSVAAGQTGVAYNSPGSTINERNTEWGGPAGIAGDSVSAAFVAILGGQVAGRSGAAVAAGASGAPASTIPGSAGNGGAGNINGSAAGAGSNGTAGRVTITEII